jgi:hypothetical protein
MRRGVPVQQRERRNNWAFRVLVMCMWLGALATILAVIIVDVADGTLSIFDFVLLALYAVPGAVAGLLVWLLIILLFR